MSSGIVAAVGSFIALTLVFTTFKTVKVRDKMNPSLPKVMKLKETQYEPYNEAYSKIEKENEAKPYSKILFFKTLLSKKYFFDPTNNKYLEDKAKLLSIYVPLWTTKEEFEKVFTSKGTSTLEKLLYIKKLLSDPETKTGSKEAVQKGSEYLYDSLFKLYYSSKAQLKLQLQEDIEVIQNYDRDAQKFTLKAYNDFYVTRFT